MQLAPERQPCSRRTAPGNERLKVGGSLNARLCASNPASASRWTARLSAGVLSINQAPITGESLPVEKAEGDAVFAGTINESGSFEYS
jgi:Cd2+/Zn2+-exporting ATPase